MKPSNVNREDSDIDLALARATLYSALALGFRSPTEETIARLGSQDAVAALASAAALLDPTREFDLAAVSSLLTPHSSLSPTRIALFSATPRAPPSRPTKPSTATRRFSNNRKNWAI